MNLEGFEPEVLETFIRKFTPLKFFFLICVKRNTQAYWFLIDVMKEDQFLLNYY
jgi:hypothetical protein